MKHQIQMLLSTAKLGDNIVACQGGGVYSKTRRHSADKTQSLTL